MTGCPSSDKKSDKDAGAPTPEPVVSQKKDVAQKKDTAKPLEPAEAKFRKAFTEIICIYRKETDAQKIVDQQHEVYKRNGYKHAIEYVDAMLKYTNKKGYLKQLEKEARAADCR